ncbi:hypothetical protein SCUCBS95973_006223 [Sporothrix curviconia]|uniref:Protein kinase domain-containing protein n=1 Tax=Sporothrix curviconia TaxID=1260050 RepID=A0ABP0C3E9_9PEZI
MYEYCTEEEPPRPADFPYHLGQTFSIRRHRAPPPFAPKYRYPPGMRRLDDCWKGPSEELSHFEQVLQNPPQERPPGADEEDKDAGLDKDPSPPDLDTVYTLHVVEEIVARAGHGAQVLRCRIDGFDGNEGDPCMDTKYVAKITMQLITAPANSLAIFQGANGRYTPAYYGSWTFDLPVPQDGSADRPATRPVRLILIEYIAGKSMYALLKEGVVDKMPIPRRLELMAEAMESLCQLEFLGIEHTDFESRNVLVLDSALNQPTNTGTDDHSQSVVIIDFNRSYVYVSHWMADRHREPRQEMVCSPMDRFWGDTLELQFAAWIPHIYHMRVPAFNGWLQHRWGNMADHYDVPSPEERRLIGLDEATEYIPPESISLPEPRIPGKVLRSLDPNYDAWLLNDSD